MGTPEIRMGQYLGGQMSITEMRTLASDFAKSNYFQDAKDAAQAVVKIQAGIEMGFGPVYSMTKIYIVKGKVMVSAEALGAMVKRSGRYDYTVKTLTDTECTLEFTDRGKTVYTSKFNMTDAKRADLLRQDSGWSKWPRAMLMSKAISQGARIVCPHVIAGVYTPADFAVETGEDGEPVKVEVIEPKAVELITESQHKKIFATAKEKGVSEETLKQGIWDKFTAAHMADLTKDEASQLIEELVSLPTATLQVDEKPPEPAAKVSATKKPEIKEPYPEMSFDDLLAYAKAHGMTPTDLFKTTTLSVDEAKVDPHLCAIEVKAIAGW